MLGLLTQINKVDITGVYIMLGQTKDAKWPQLNYSGYPSA